MMNVSVVSYECDGITQEGLCSSGHAVSEGEVFLSLGVLDKNVAM